METVVESGLLTFIFILGFMAIGGISGVWLWEKKLRNKFLKKIKNHLPPL